MMKFKLTLEGGYHREVWTIYESSPSFSPLRYFRNCGRFCLCSWEQELVLGARAGSDPEGKSWTFTTSFPAYTAKTVTFPPPFFSFLSVNNSKPGHMSPRLTSIYNFLWDWKKLVTIQIVQNCMGHLNSIEILACRQWALPKYFFLLIR
jgi:hypothetical protein